uniref:Uncharacterized protein n=1 Tax=Sphaerodactylus townsendi TaxID=933632 RepID=A0ACB8EZ68_9SAUR
MCSCSSTQARPTDHAYCETGGLRPIYSPLWLNKEGEYEATFRYHDKSGLIKPQLVVTCLCKQFKRRQWVSGLASNRFQIRVDLLTYKYLLCSPNKGTQGGMTSLQFNPHNSPMR